MLYESLMEMTVDVLKSRLKQQILSLFCTRIDTNQWELSEKLTLAALEQGQSTQDFYSFLEQRCEEKLPEAVDDFFAQLQHQ